MLNIENTLLMLLLCRYSHVCTVQSGPPGAAKNLGDASFASPRARTLRRSDGRPVAGLAAFGEGSSWQRWVGHGHGALDWALAEQPSVGGPVFAADGGHGGAAEGQGQVPASAGAHCPYGPVTFLQEGGDREPRRQPPVGRVVPGRQSLQGLAGLHAVHVQGRDLHRLTRQLLVDQVLVQETVQTLVDLLQVHLFVLQDERSHSRVGGYSGGESKGVIKEAATRSERWRQRAKAEKER